MGIKGYILKIRSLNASFNENAPVVRCNEFVLEGYGIRLAKNRHNTNANAA
jgi:hypothetical protein